MLLYFSIILEMAFISLSYLNQKFIYLTKFHRPRPKNFESSLITPLIITAHEPLYQVLPLKTIVLKYYLFPAAFAGLLVEID